MEDTGSVAVAERRTPSAASLTTTGSPMDLLHAAVLQGTPVEQISKLVDLYERMEVRQAAKDFADAMAAIQSELKAIPHNKTKEKDATRSGGNFSYTWASLDQIAAVLNPVAAKHGISYKWDTVVSENGKMLTSTCTVRHVHGHTDSSSFTLPTDGGSPAMSPQQRFASAEKFAHRHSLASAFGLTTTGDSPDEDASDPATIDEAQLLQLEDMLSDTGADVPKFLAFLGIESLGSLRAADFDKAVMALRQYKAKKQGAK
jgi:hypothetical protein